MNRIPFLNGLLVLMLAIAALFTGEIVTYIMLGFVLMALNNIHIVLKEIRDILARRGNGHGKAADSGENPRDR